MTDTIIGEPGKSFYTGYMDAVLISPDLKHTVTLKYEGEPPHGDSYHSISVDGVNFPGLCWAGMFVWSDESRYFCGEWMAQKYERNTIVIDCELRKYFVLPLYFSDYRFHFPKIDELGAKPGTEPRSYEFTGQENWQQVMHVEVPVPDWVDGENLEDWYSKLTAFYMSKGLTLELAETNTKNVRKALATYPKARQLISVRQILGIPPGQ